MRSLAAGFAEHVVHNPTSTAILELWDIEQVLDCPEVELDSEDDLIRVVLRAAVADEPPKKKKLADFLRRILRIRFVTPGLVLQLLRLDHTLPFRQFLADALLSCEPVLKPRPSWKAKHLQPWTMCDFLLAVAQQNQEQDPSCLSNSGRDRKRQREDIVKEESPVTKRAKY